MQGTGRRTFLTFLMTLLMTFVMTLALGATGAAQAAHGPPGAQGGRATQVAQNAETAEKTAVAPSFYEPPQPLPPGENGDIIRTEAAEFFLDPLKTIPAPAKANRVMYRSTDTHGEPNAVTGTVLTPNVPWIGNGERPVVAYAAGTQGLGDDCAPSRALAAGLEYEGPFISGLLLRGYAVVVTDYEGLGTPGVHTYTNRLAQGHAVLDSVRAAQRLPEADLPDAGPVATAGYSQGGGASASAGELAPSYAPELDLKGVYAGASPAELGAVAKNLDGAYAAGFGLFAIAAINAAYPDLGIEDLLNDKGKQTLADVEEECTVEALLKHPFTKSADLTVDGRPITEYLKEEPYASVLADQQLGRTAPTVPVLGVHSALDDIVPFEQGRQMARDWCADGAHVQFSTSYVPTHIGGAIRAFPEAFAWLEGRFAGAPAPDNCGKF